MTNEFDGANDQAPDETQWRHRSTAKCTSTHGLPELVSAAYEQGPTPVRMKFIEYLLTPVGPLAMLAIADGAFAHLPYRLEGDTVRISLDDTARITSSHILELARYLEQCSPEALLRIGSLIAEGPSRFVTIGGSALLIGLIDWMGRQGDYCN
jgi:hypothetical protein